MGLDSVVTLALGLGTGGTAERRLRPGPGPRGCPAWGLVDQRGHMQDWVPPSPPGAPRQQGPRQSQPAGFSQVLWQGQVGRDRGGRNSGPPFRYLLYNLSLGPWTPQNGPKPLTAHPTKQPLRSSYQIRELPATAREHVQSRTQMAQPSPRLSGAVHWGGRPKAHGLVRPSSKHREPRQAAAPKPASSLGRLRR